MGQRTEIRQVLDKLAVLLLLLIPVVVALIVWVGTNRTGPAPADAVESPERTPASSPASDPVFSVKSDDQGSQERATPPESPEGPQSESPRTPQSQDTCRLIVELQSAAGGPMGGSRLRYATLEALEKSLAPRTTISREHLDSELAMDGEGRAELDVPRNAAVVFMTDDEYLAPSASLQFNRMATVELPSQSWVVDCFGVTEKHVVLTVRTCVDIPVTIAFEDGEAFSGSIICLVGEPPTTRMHTRPRVGFRLRGESGFVISMVPQESRVTVRVSAGRDGYARDLTRIVHEAKPESWNIVVPERMDADSRGIIVELPGLAPDQSVRVRFLASSGSFVATPRLNGPGEVSSPERSGRNTPRMRAFIEGIDNDLVGDTGWVELESGVWKRVRPELTPASSVTLRVVDADGKPVSGAVVMTIPDIYATEKMLTRSVGTNRKSFAQGTDEGGRVTFNRVPPGTHTYYLEAWGFARTPVQVDVPASGQAVDRGDVEISALDEFNHGTVTVTLLKAESPSDYETAVFYVGGMDVRSMQGFEEDGTSSFAALPLREYLLIVRHKPTGYIWNRRFELTPDNRSAAIEVDVLVLDRRPATDD